MRAVAIGLVLLAVPLGIAPARAASSQPLRVEVEGVTGELLRNVVARLSIAQRRGRVPEAEARDLHGRARNEIELALQPFGHYAPSVWSTFESARGRWVARYTVDPGPVTRIDTLDVRVLGAGSADTALLNVVGRLPVRAGDPLDHAAYEESKRMLTAAAMRNGYIDARFVRHELRVDLRDASCAVVLHLESGPLWRFGPVTFEQDAVDPELLEGYVTFRPGEPVDMARLLEMEQALGNSPTWSKVEVRPRRDRARGDALPIVVALEASKNEKYTAGVGYGTDDGAHARAIVELRRLNRRGHRADLQSTASRSEQSAVVNYQVPWPYPRTDVLTTSIGYTQRVTVNTEQRTGAAGVHLSRLWGGWQQIFALQYRREAFRIGPDEGISGFVVPEASWGQTLADDPIDPRHARRLLFRVSGAHRRVFSAASYGRVEGLARWIHALGSRHRLIARGDVGHLWTDEFSELPPSLRFFAGGANSVRGYEYNRLGPRDPAGNVLGGSVLAVASAEYEYRFAKSYGVAAFYDAGNAMRSLAQPLRHGAGVGLRWVSPIGLVRGDLGWPLSGSSRRVQFHLSIGPSL
jgi:translocation and assembly module TamA